VRRTKGGTGTQKGKILLAWDEGVNSRAERSRKIRPNVQKKRAIKRSATVMKRLLLSKELCIAIYYHLKKNVSVLGIKILSTEKSIL
jgi:hypothetical protein